MGLCCGIDLHSNNHVLTVIDDADRRVYELVSLAFVCPHVATYLTQADDRFASCR